MCAFDARLDLRCTRRSRVPRTGIRSQATARETRVLGPPFSCYAASASATLTGAACHFFEGAGARSGKRCAQPRSRKRDRARFDPRLAAGSSGAPGAPAPSRAHTEPLGAGGQRAQAGGLGVQPPRRVMGGFGCGARIVWGVQWPPCLDRLELEQANRTRPRAGRDGLRFAHAFCSMERPRAVYAVLRSRPFLAPGARGSVRAPLDRAYRLAGGESCSKCLCCRHVDPGCSEGAAHLPLHGGLGKAVGWASAAVSCLALAGSIAAMIAASLASRMRRATGMRTSSAS